MIVQMTKLTLILGNVLFLVHAAFGQTTGQISGIVTDEATQEPLAGVKIVIVEGTLETTTDKDGSYKLINVLRWTICNQNESDWI